MMAGPTLQRGLRATIDALLAVTLAPRCVACEGPLEAPLAGPACSACWAAIRRLPPPRCRRCGDSLPPWRLLSLERACCAPCRRRPSVLDAARAAGHYEGALREIVHAFKYDGRRTLAIRLGCLMRDAGSDLLADADAAVAVPLHPWKRLTRGFNQAEDLARTLDLPLIRALWRTRATLPQSGLAADERRRNVRDAFAISPLLTRRTLERELAGRTILLVDDVRTTGATLEACARVLKGAGVANVAALTAARASVARRAP